MNPYEETADTLRDFLRGEGYVRCSSPACACGSWHGRDGLHARWREIKDALAEAGHPLTNANGNTPLRALHELIADRDRLLYALRYIGSKNGQAREAVANGTHNTTFAIDLSGIAQAVADGGTLNADGSITCATHTTSGS